MCNRQVAISEGYCQEEVLTFYILKIIIIYYFHLECILHNLLSFITKNEVMRIQSVNEFL